MNPVLPVRQTTLLSLLIFEVMHGCKSSGHNGTGDDADGFALLEDLFSGSDRAKLNIVSERNGLSRLNTKRRACAFDVDFFSHSDIHEDGGYIIFCMHSNGSRHSPGLRLVRGIVPPYQPILGVPKKPTIAPLQESELVVV